MLSKNEIKLITSLQQKKYRIRSGFFLAEGVKVVNECIQSSYNLQNIYALDSYQPPIENLPIQYITEKELKKISTLATPNEVIAIVEIPEDLPLVNKGVIMALDGVRDPGNLGTIIRLCDWFGIETLVCSKDTVDCYNPKVIQATMGSIVRVNIHYLELVDYLKNSKLPIYYTVLNGENIYQINLPKEAVIVMGSESHGIKKELLELKHHALTIPQKGQKSTIDSLNVATAAAIVINEFCK